jgi:hypothetical protein
MWIFPQKRTSLTFCETSPHAEFHTIIQGISTTLVQHWALPTNDRRTSLSCTANEQRIRITIATISLHDPIATLAKTGIWAVQERISRFLRNQKCGHVFSSWHLGAITQFKSGIMNLIRHL